MMHSHAGQWSAGRILRHRLLPLVLFVLAIVFIAMGCNEVIDTVESGNPSVKVDLLAEFDGVKVYRVWQKGNLYIYVATRSEGSIAITKP